VSGVRREARETAREAARRAGLSIGEWLDSIILESAEADDVESRRPAEREYSHHDEFREDEARPRRNRYAEYDGRCELAAVIKELVDKIEGVQLTRGDHAALGHLEDRMTKLVENLDASDARLNHLEAIERGLAELLIHLEHQRVPNLARAGSPPPEVDELSRDVADLRQTGKKTQESLEVVRGTLGHVVDRLAMIETDMRGKPVRGTESFAVHAPSVAPAPPSKLEEAPGAGRRPIDPILPPDHPLEPGSGGSRRGSPGSPAGRIAASESVLIGAKPPVISDPGGNSTGIKSNFIAAARRAAQAAGREAPVKSAASGSREIASAAGKLASRVGKLRALIGGTTAIVIVLGALQIARTFLGSPQEAEVGSPEGQSQTIVARPERPADVAIATLPDVNQAAPALSEPASPKPASEPATGRQSAVLPTGEGSPLAGSGIVIPIEIARQAPGAAIAQSTSSAALAAEHEVAGSIPAPAVSASAKPATAPVAAASTPSMPAPAPTPAQQISALSPTASDKLPATFGSSLRAAANKGDAAAQYEIAQRYAEGRGVAQNLANAAEWFERAAKQGLAPAQFRLGRLYEKGLGVKKSLETARRFYVAAAQAGNAKALHNLAVLYAEGIDGKPDYQAAARWFGKAAGYAFADSQYNLAILYARGIGVEQNVAEAYKWFALAARDGDMESAKKRDDLGARLDRQSLNAAMAAIQSSSPRRQCRSRHRRAGGTRLPRRRPSCRPSESRRWSGPSSILQLRVLINKSLAR
jgi:localization factor PodJL